MYIIDMMHAYQYITNHYVITQKWRSIQNTTWGKVRTRMERHYDKMINM